MLQVRVVQRERDRRSQLEALQAKRVNLLDGVNLLGDLLSLRRGFSRTVFGAIAGSELFEEIALALRLLGRLGIFLIDLVEGELHLGLGRGRKRHQKRRHQ